MLKFFRSPVIAAIIFLIGVGIAKSTVYKWSQTAGNNSNADSTINYAEGQAPSSLNDSGRAVMAAIAKWRDDMAGSLTTGGTSTAYTVTSNQGFTSLSAMSGAALRIKINADNGASPTLNVDGLGAKSIVSVHGTAIVTGALRANGIYDFSYNNSNSEWTVVGLTSEFASGTQIVLANTGCPVGWTKNVDPVGNDATIRLVTGSTGGGTGGSTAFSTVMAARTIAQANLPSYTLPNTLALNDPGHTHTLNNGSSVLRFTSGAINSPGGGSLVLSDTLSVASATTGITITGGVQSGGSGTALDFATKYVDFVVCQKN